MHSVPDCQGQLAEQICADTGTKTKQQLEEKFGLTRLIGIYQSTSNAIHTTFFFFERAYTHSRHRSEKVLSAEIYFHPIFNLCQQTVSRGCLTVRNFKRSPDSGFVTLKVILIQG